MNLLKVFCFILVLSSTKCDQKDEDTTEAAVTNSTDSVFDLEVELETGASNVDEVSEITTFHTTTNPPDPTPKKEEEPKKEEPEEVPEEVPKEVPSEEPKQSEEDPSEMEEKPSDPQPLEKKSESKSGLRKGSVWGIAIGVIGMVTTTVLLVVFILKRRRGDDRLIR